MNKEIKFRAWLKNEKKMVIVSELRNIDTDIKSDENIIYFDFEKQEYCCKGFDEVELMQYTGLKDKNGVEIYEGDIVKCNTNETFEIDDIGEVVYDDDCCASFINFNEGCIHLTSAWNLEVIDNIYENKELLENE